MEVLTIAVAHNFKIKEVGVLWTEYGGGHVPLKAYLESLSDLVKIKLNSLSGKYSPSAAVPPLAVTPRDYDLAGLAGFLTGICLIPTALNIGIHNLVVLVLLPFVGRRNCVWSLAGKILIPLDGADAAIG